MMLVPLAPENVASFRASLHERFRASLRERFRTIALAGGGG